MAEFTEELFSRLHVLNKREKLQIMQFLVKELTLEEETKSNALPKSEWPPNYFIETYGALRDDPITRPEQGIFEVREELE